MFPTFPKNIFRLEFRNMLPSFKEIFLNELGELSDYQGDSVYVQEDSPGH